MNNAQPNLFSTSPFDAVATRPRARQIERAFEKGDRTVLDRYTQVFFTFRGKEFGAWDVTAAYESLHGKLSKTDKKALGHLFGDFRHRGVIVVAGIGKRPNGNDAATYKFK